MSVSGLSGSSGTSLLSILQNLSNTGSSSSSSSTSSISSPQDFLTSELEKQGYSGSKLSDLQSKIESAVQSVQSSSSGQIDPSKIHDAINSVLKQAGVDTNQIDADAKAQGPGGMGPPPGGANGASGTSSSTDSTDSTDSSTENEITSLLKKMGVDPQKFESALSSALQNSSNTGTLDLSQLFASAGTGSQVNIWA